MIIFFFFQAEDGIRDYKVTGVQTCALPICRAFAAQWAEAIFTAHGSRESAQAFYADIKGQAQRLGRRPQDIVILPGISAAIGSTEYEARQVWEELDSLTSIEVGLARLSARFGGHDFSAVPLDRLLTRDDFPDPDKVEASRSRAVGYVETSLRDGLNLRGLLKRDRKSV